MSQKKIKINLIVATGERGEIGIGNQLLGHFPTDMQYFKEKTKNAVVIMGRKTFDSLYVKPLPMRKNIVITRDENFEYPDTYVVHSIKEAVSRAEDLANGEREIFVIGGAAIYREFIESKQVDRIYLTKINRHFKEADAFIDLPRDWEVVESKSVVADGVKMEFIVMQSLE